MARLDHKLSWRFDLFSLFEQLRSLSRSGPGKASRDVRGPALLSEASPEFAALVDGHFFAATEWLFGIAVAAGSQDRDDRPLANNLNSPTESDMLIWAFVVRG